MPGAIANASTLINLASIGRLELLREFEVERAREAGWIVVQAPQNRDLVKILQRDLDEGEAEAIALAVERKAAVVFLDETDARRVTADIYQTA